MTSRQLRALAVSAARELRWGLWAVRSELAIWQRRAEAIPDPRIRLRALNAMDKGRTLVDGAALFWTLPSRRRLELLRSLVALQTLLNFVDLALEDEADQGDGRPGSWMWLARDALDLTRPPPRDRIRDAVGDDGGFLLGLIYTCRAGCARLPHYEQARELLVRETDRSVAFEIEHDRDRPRRLARMDQFCVQQFSDVVGLTSWELIGGASSLLTAMAVLGIAADDDAGAEDLRRAADAYVWVASAAALLDSYSDQDHDRRTGSHNWRTYYAGPQQATERTATLLRQAISEVSALRHGERHEVIVASMAALALSDDAARRPAHRPCTRAIAQAGGAMTTGLIPILRTWRRAYGRTAD